MTELKTLQYPRWIHRGSESKLVDSPEACDADMDAGWVLSPDDEARPIKPQPIPVEISEHAGSETDARPPVDDVPEPDAPKRRKAHKSRS